MKAAREQGFSLLELLVTLAIIALIVTLLGGGLQFNGAQRVIDQQAQRLSMVLNWMCESAESDGRIFGLSLSQGSYGVVMPPAIDAPVDAPWTEIANRSSFAAFNLPEGLTLALELESQASVDGLPADRPARPQLVCAANSELPNFRIVLRNSSNPPMIRIIRAQLASVETPNTAATEVEKDASAN